VAELRLDGVTKIYDDARGTETAVDDVSLDVEDGELVAIVGPSGCGKSTTLRMVAGLETVTEGTIEIGDREVQELVPSRRNIAMVFQNYALYSTMSSRKNMEYGLKHSTDLSKEERRDRVEEIAHLLGIEDLLDTDPGDLSGGQRQRVALGRAIVREPEAFLLDEPLSNLDAKLRSHMRTELQRIQQEIGVTTLYVTHDQKEAMTMGDRIAIMNDGVLQQIAPPEEAYHHPANLFVATFLGSPSMNLFGEVEVTESGDEYGFALDGTELARIPRDAVDELDPVVSLGVRPEGLQLSEDPSDGTFPAEVVIAEYQGENNFIHLSIPGRDENVTARAPSQIFPAPGDTVGVSIEPADVYVFDADSGAALKTQGLEGRGAAGRASGVSSPTEGDLD
jgi:multiple sugar transport system ATP-binding protein